jgi:putative heme-binding domain-containing protein
VFLRTRRWSLVIVLSVPALMLPAPPLLAACDALRPFAGSSGAYTHDQLVERGRQVFEQNCAVCHGLDASGGRGPNLRRVHIARAPDDEALCELIETGIPPEMPDGSFLTDQDVRELVTFVRSLGESASAPLTGDPQRGARVFAASGCLSCHIFGGEGRGFGPELTDLSDRRSPSFIREVLLNPASRLPSEFLWVRLSTKAGEIVQGIRINEDNYSIQLKEADGSYRSFDKSALGSVDRLKGETPMPSFAHLSSADLQDLVAYLLTPRSVP